MMSQTSQVQASASGVSLPFFDGFKIVQERIIMTSTKSPYANLVFGIFGVVFAQTYPTDTIGVALVQLTISSGQQPLGLQFAIDTAIYDDFIATISVPPYPVITPCVNGCNEPDFSDIDAAFEREFENQRNSDRPQEDRDSGYDRTEPRRD